MTERMDPTLLRELKDWLRAGNGPDSLVPYIKRHLTDCNSRGLEMDEAFDIWNTELAELVMELGLMRH